MDQIRELLETRRKYLLKLKADKEKALKKVPEGKLRICSSGGRTQYYQRDNAEDLVGRYIKEKDAKLAMDLAQKDYDQRVLRVVEGELQALAQFLRKRPVVVAEEVYEKLHPERQKLIMPIRETDEQYAAEWARMEYVGKGIDGSLPKHDTARGERVRSKSEVIIADLLYREGIPYRYECPLYLEGMGTVHPDFTVLNVRERKEMYWEHLGIMDDPDYAERALERIACYEQNGIFLGKNLILTFECKNLPINQTNVALLVRQYLK